MNDFVKPKNSLGLAVFFLVLLLLVFVATPVQLAWGMWGLAVTELIILAAAIIPALLYKWDLKEVFPLDVPSPRQITGVCILWFGSYVAVTAVSSIIIYFFPQGLWEVSRYITELFRSTPFPVTLFIAAVMPAVCEEALHRGLIQYTFGTQKKWVLVLAMGLIFGLFHLDPYRFLGTAILGAVMTYIMAETNNLVLPMLFHLINNSFSTFATFVNDPTTTAEAVGMPLASVGAFLIFTAVTPFLFVIGTRFLKSKGANKQNGKKEILAAAVAALILILIGLAVSAAA